MLNNHWGQWRLPLPILAAGALLCSPAGLAARQLPLDGPSFRIGSQDNLCSAQEDIIGRAGSGLRDRSWQIVCKDASRPVGQIHLIHEASETNRITGARLEALTCDAQTESVIARLGRVAQQNCLSSVSNARWNSYMFQHADTLYAAEGVSAYDEVIRLALRTVISNQSIDEVPALPLLSSVSGGSYYRMQAARLSASLRIEQGYRSNNSGAFAQAVEYFDPATAQFAPDDDGSAHGQRLLEHDMLVNHALQLSNLGAFDRADAAFAQARAMNESDLVQTRLARNLEALHRINLRDLDGARAIMAQTMPPVPLPLEQQDSSVTIGTDLADALSVPGRSNSRVFTVASRLSPSERAQILDAQATQINGTIARLSGAMEDALRAFNAAEAQASAIRDGRVTAIYRMRSQIMSEKAMMLEQTGRIGEAEGLLRRALALLETEYPDTMATHSARAALAAFLARNGKPEDARATYKALVASLSDKRLQLVGLEHRIAPYFDLLTAIGTQTPEQMADLFQVSQRVVRPGAASTTEQLSMQFQSGDSESAALYRQSLDLRREIERMYIEIAQLSSLPNPTEISRAEAASLRARVDDLSARQIATLDKLAADPKFRALTVRDVTMDEMLHLLKPDEAYLKLSQVGGDLYAVYLSRDHQQGWKLPLDAATLRDRVQHLRDSILLTINGVDVTYPFDVDAARQLYLDIFTPVADRMTGIHHLIFEPDGAMLQLPVNLLITDQTSVDAYHSHVAAEPDADYDFRGIAWLGRTHTVSTALSAASFMEMRKLQQSTAPRAYLGLGQNAPASPASYTASLNPTRSATLSASSANAPRCDWPIGAWNNPISDSELRQAASLFGPANADLLTGAAFSDKAVLQRTDLQDFRVLHFATHGLLAPPASGCPARPALLTSFGGEGSDGLLEFREIFDLRLNADLVILSACDTAAQASREVTREAGIESGGGSALDGLVRAFIGAGSRTVIASHWPAPDSYQATYRLMTGLFSAGSGSSLGDALRHSQLSLMDDAATSHPFYWAGFALVGDGAQAAPHGQ